MKETEREKARYGIDIRGLSTHTEAHSLIEIVALLKDQVGDVYIIDRETNSPLYYGDIDDVRQILARSITKRTA